MARTRIAEAAGLLPGTGTTVDAAGRRLAVFNVDGTLYGVDSTCPHRGGPLGEGDLDGAPVSCPWHGWRYDVTTGARDEDPRSGWLAIPSRSKAASSACTSERGRRGGAGPRPDAYWTGPLNRRTP